MTALAWIPVLTRRQLAFAAVALMGAAIGGTDVRVHSTEVSAARVVIPQAAAASLIAATSGGHSAENRAIGIQAKLINAAIPLSSAPVSAARPFVLSNSDPLDRRRALLCLTQAIYYEAGFEPIEGQRGIAQVVLNRMRHPAFPKSVCGVIYQGAREPVCQFSFVCDGSLYRRPALGAWKQAEQVAAAALGGFVEKAVGAATHYHADYVAPYWAPRLAKITRIGAHIFYRWPGAWGSTAALTGRYIGEPNDPMALRSPIRQAVLTDGSVVPVDDPALSGPPIARTPDDVGGLLDPSKGWALDIPGPSESNSATKTVADHQIKAPEPAMPATLAAR